MTYKKAKTYEEVNFRFAVPDDGTYAKETGTVLVRPGEMVIDIKDDDGTSFFLIVGNFSDNFFTGNNMTTGAYRPKVQAKWSDFGEIQFIGRQTFIGRWREDGVEYVFTFWLPRSYASYLGNKGKA